jgi:glyoxylase-like metal-dependent hydrolase (beta-lactamase superfamily II)
MAPRPDRRHFLQILLAGAGLSRGAAAAALPPALLRRPAASDAVAQGPLAAANLTEDVTLISGAGGNVLAVMAPDDLALINGGVAERSADLLKLLAGRTGGARVRTLFNTDWHPHHTGANETLGAAGTAIVAHEHTKQYLGAELFVDWQNRTYKPLSPRALPSKTFYTSGRLTVGRQRVEYGPLGQAHTDGDIYVFLPDANVLMTGDVLSVGAYPIADYTTGGWLGGLATATKTLLDLANADTRVVPGTGPLQTRADLQAQYDMLVALRDRLVKMMKQGMGADDMLAAAPTKDFDAVWGRPELFVSTAYRGLWLHVRELGGIV